MKPDTLKAVDVLRVMPSSQRKGVQTFIKVVRIITVIFAVLSIVMFFINWCQKDVSNMISSVLQLFVFVTSFYSLSESAKVPSYYLSKLQSTETYVDETTKVKVPLARKDVSPEFATRFDESILSDQLTIVPDSDDWEIEIETRKYRSAEVNKMLPKDKQTVYTIKLYIPYPMYYIVDNALQPTDFDDLIRERKIN